MMAVGLSHRTRVQPSPIYEQGNALAGSDCSSLIAIGERAHASHTSPGGWSVLSDRSDKPIDVDGESILKDHSVRVDGNEPRCAAPGTLSHSDNGRLSTPWREMIFLLTVMDSIFEPSSPALVYGPKSAFG
jgi:hypothetical protein